MNSARQAGSHSQSLVPAFAILALFIAALLAWLVTRSVTGPLDLLKAGRRRRSDASTSGLVQDVFQLA